MNGAHPIMDQVLSEFRQALDRAATATKTAERLASRVAAPPRQCAELTVARELIEKVAETQT